MIFEASKLASTLSRPVSHTRPVSIQRDSYQEKRNSMRNSVRDPEPIHDDLT